MMYIFAATESLNLNITIDSIVGSYFLPVILPAILFLVSVTIWAYLVSKNKTTLRNNWIIPVAFLVVAVAIAVVFHHWGKVSY